MAAGRRHTTTRGWGDLREALEDWHVKRTNATKHKMQQDIEELRANIVHELHNPGKAKPQTSSLLEARTNITSEAKKEMLKPESADTKNPLTGLDLYANSIVTDDESTGTKTTYVVKIEDARKKDETSGMSLAKIAKATEFGTTKSAPRPAWRRSLKRLEQTGVYKKKIQ